MFGFAGRNTPARPTLDSIRFETAGLRPRGEPMPGKTRAWGTPDGDGVGVYLFARPPNLPRARTLAELRAHYDALMEEEGGTVVDVALIRVDACDALRTIVTVGFTYVGSVTIPFRDFSFVLKIQAADDTRDPEARTRRALDHMAATARLDASIKALPGFALPNPA